MILKKKWTDTAFNYMTPDKQKTIAYLTRRLKECVNFLDRRPDNRILLKRYDDLKLELEEINLDIIKIYD